MKINQIKFFSILIVTFVYTIVLSLLVSDGYFLLPVFFSLFCIVTCYAIIRIKKSVFEEYEINIGKKTHKTSKEGTEPNPFKSGFKVNTIKGVIEHPQLKIAAYTFIEDESYVECRRCVIIE